MKATVTPTSEPRDERMGPGTGERPSPESGRDQAAGAASPAEPDGVDDLPLAVRSIRLVDAPSLARLQVVHRLHQPDATLLAYSAFRGGVRSAIPGLRSSKPAFVAASGDRLVGFVQFQQLPPDNRWALLALGASVGVYQAEPVWEALLTWSARAAGLRGVRRLYARVPQGSELSPLLSRLGWQAYTAETIYQATDVRRRRRSRPVIRRQVPADTWAVHQLYAATVPRPVQDCEALTSHRWDVLRRARGRRDVVANGWVVDDGHEIVAHVGALSRGQTHLLEVMVRPDRRALFADILDDALAMLPGRGMRRVLCALRAYQVDLGPVLEEGSFVPIMDQDLHLRYTTASLRLPVGEPFPFALDVREKVPQRVPTFFLDRPQRSATRRDPPEEGVPVAELNASITDGVDPRRRLVGAATRSAN